MDRLPERLVVVGASGWLGRATLSLARQWWGSAADSRIAAFGSTERLVPVPGGEFLQKPLQQLAHEDLSESILLHFAFLTKDRLRHQSDRDFMMGNFLIDDTVADAIRQSRPGSIFVASSGAAARVGGGGGDAYGLMKLAQEQRFRALGDELKIPILRGRIWSIAGPFINKPGAYALADFLLQADRDRRVVIRSQRPVYRSYLHCEDLVARVVQALMAGDIPKHVVDLAGAEVVEMSDLAAEALRAVGADDHAIERPSLEFGDRDIYVGDPIYFKELCLSENRRPVPFSKQVLDTLNYLKL